MKTEKTICIVMLNMTQDYRDDYIIGIEKQAAKLGYHTITFSLPLLDEIHTKKEEELYQLIDFDLYDGVIFFENSFSSHKSLGDMVENMIHEKCHMPVVVLGESKHFNENYLPDNTIGAQTVTDHAIEKHGCETLYFLGGEPGQKLHNDIGFMNSLTSHGISYTSDNLIYGGYWNECGEALAKDIAYHVVEKPDAVICQDDTVAFFFIKSLAKYGIRVPEDMIVTGFGARNDSKNNILSITTYPSNVEYYGRKVVSRLHSLITKTKELPIIFPKSNIITGDSCGCGNSKPTDVRLLLEQHEKNRLEEIYYRNSELEEKFYNSRNYRELHPVIFHSSYLIQDINFLAINIRENETFSRCIYMSNQAWSDTPLLFRSMDIFPDDLPKHHSKHLHVLPLTFNEQFLGHVVIGYDAPLTYNTILKQYVSKLSVTLTHINHQQLLQEQANKKNDETALQNAQAREMIFIKKENSLHKIALENVLYFESEGRKTITVTKGGRYEIKKTLSQLEGQYSEQNFFRVSKSALVNLSKVTSITPNTDRTLTASFSPKMTVRVSRKHANEFKEKIKES